MCEQIVHPESRNDTGEFNGNCNEIKDTSVNSREDDNIDEKNPHQKEYQLDIQVVIKERALHKKARMYYLFLKRLFDILASLIAMILCLPLFLFFTAIVKAVSNNGKICSDIKYGYMGKKFKTYRLFVPETVKSKKIIYITKFIEKTRLNKLMMFINVFKGDMSIVGPKPLNYIEQYKTDIMFVLRLSVKPGMICLWNSHGDAGRTNNEMIKLDLKYIRERNFVNDMRIIAETFLKHGNSVK